MQAIPAPLESADNQALVPVIPESPFRNCLVKAQQLTDVLSTTERLGDFFKQCIQSRDEEPLPRILEFTAARASIRFDFFGNRLFTSFDGEEKEVKLSCALGISCDLSEIFMKIMASEDRGRHIELEGQLHRALEFNERSVSKIIIDGKELAAFYPENQRVVLTTSRGQSSNPMSMIQSCGHLFSHAFGQEICPKIGVKGNVKSLLIAVHKIYIGRCLLGLIHGVGEAKISHTVYERELARIVTLIKMPGHAFYTEPKF